MVSLASSQAPLCLQAAGGCATDDSLLGPTTGSPYPLVQSRLLSCARTLCSKMLQGLSSLRVLDVGGNQLRRVEVLAACRGLTLMTDLNISGNPLEAVQDARLHVVHLLTQVCSFQPSSGVACRIRTRG